LYTEGTNKLGYMEDMSKRVYIEGVYSGVYAISRNKVVYVEFAGYCCLVLLIAENRSTYTLSKINIG
jgi:hypothetical protein